MTLDQGPTPLYFHLKSILKSKILSNELSDTTEIITFLEGKMKTKVKLPAHRAGLPGNVISFYIVPLDPAYPDKTGQGTFRSIVRTKP